MLYLSGIILSFFLSFVLITKKNKTKADYILFAWLGVTGFHLFTFYLIFTGAQFDYPSLVIIGISLPLAQGPFLYLYTRQQVSAALFSNKSLLHFIPLLVSWLLFTKFHLLPFSEKATVIRQEGKGFETQLLINICAINISGIVYTILSVIKLLRYRKSIPHQFSNTEKINFNWLLYLITWIIIIWIAVLFSQDDKIIFGAASVFVFWLGYFGIKQVKVFSQPEQKETEIPATWNTNGEDMNPEHTLQTVYSHVSSDEKAGNTKYLRSTLTEKEASQIHERLHILLLEQKLFTNPDLTLAELAAKMKVHANRLSQVINSKENKSFYDLINEKRVEHFVATISQPGQQQFTLLSLAFDSGFNSKASFNRNFKKYMGLTPSEYLKTLQESPENSIILH